MASEQQVQARVKVQVQVRVRVQVPLQVEEQALPPFHLHHLMKIINEPYKQRLKLTEAGVGNNGSVLMSFRVKKRHQVALNVLDTAWHVIHSKP